MTRMGPEVTAGQRLSWDVDAGLSDSQSRALFTGPQLLVKNYRQGRETLLIPVALLQAGFFIIKLLLGILNCGFPGVEGREVSFRGLEANLTEGKCVQTIISPSRLPVVSGHFCPTRTAVGLSGPRSFFCARLSPGSLSWHVHSPTPRPPWRGRQCGVMLPPLLMTLPRAVGLLAWSLLPAP